MRNRLGGDACGSPRMQGRISECRLREPERSRRIGHARKWVYVGYADQSICVCFLFCRTATTVNSVAIKSWYKR
jgi:hypothetical protein